MSTTTELKTDVAPELPTENPEHVIITCPLLCKTHGWTLGSTYPTVKRYRQIEGFRDANGYCIYVLSVSWNNPVQLFSNNYKLTEQNIQK